MEKPLQQSERTVLPNGLTIVSEHLENVRSVAIGLWIKNGSRSENGDEKGLAHFIEHLVFKGTSTRNSFAIANSLERLGGSLNAYTAKEMTVFYAKVLDEHLTTAVDVLADIASRPTFAADDIERERNVVIEEINSTYDMPDEVCQDAFLEELYPTHALGYPILGTTTSIRGFQRSQVLNFWQERFQPHNTVIAASGNVLHSDLVALVERFLQLPEGGKRIVVEPVNGRLGRSKHIHMVTTQAHLCLGLRSYAYGDSRRFALAALNNYLGGGMSSVLFQKVREEHALAYSVYSFADFYRDTGSFGFYLATDEKQVDKAKNLVLEEFARVANGDIPAGVVSDLRSQLKGELLLGLDSIQRRMSRLAHAEIYFDSQESIEDIIARIDELSRDAIVAAAEDMYRQELIEIMVLPTTAKRG
jgi:predicted Zn-dependent peptidase